MVIPNSFRLTVHALDPKLLTVAPDTQNNSPDRTPVKRWAKVRLWAGYIYILFALILAKPVLSWAVAGFVLVLLGASVRLMANATLIKDRELVTHGIYRMTRNPLYLGSSLVAIGFALMSWSFWILGVLVFILIPLYSRMISIEEKYLTALYPDAFPSYMKSVPKFLPDFSRIGNLSGTMDISRLKSSKELVSTALFILLSLILLLIHRTWIPG